MDQRERSAKWYAAHKDLPEFKEKQRAYQKEYLSRPGVTARREFKRLLKPENLILNTARYRAKRDGLDFNIELVDIIIPDKCPILGISIFKSTNGRVQNNSPSLDRINNSRGYVKGNVRIISNKANAMKREHTLETFERFIQYIKGEL